MYLFNRFDGRRFGEQFGGGRRVERYRLYIDAGRLRVVAIVINNVWELHAAVINILGVSNLVFNQPAVSCYLVTKTHWQVRLPVEQEIGRPVRLEPDGDDVGALARTCLFASGVTDLDSGIFHRGAQKAVNVEIQSFQVL